MKAFKYKNKVTIVVLTKNEGQGIKQIIQSLKPYADDILVVDGHSRDNTKEIVRQEKVRYFLDHGLGRGDGVRIGIQNAKHNCVILFDADGSHTSSDIPRFILPIINHQADVVIGSRRTGGSFDLNMSFSGILRSGGADFLTYLVNRRFGTKLSDVLYSFRGLNRKAALQMGLTANDFCIEQELV